MTVRVCPRAYKTMVPSSNGRTPLYESGNRGSNPLGAIHNTEGGSTMRHLSNIPGMIVMVGVLGYWVMVVYLISFQF